MRISDWSSDVCSSDLQHMPFGHPGLRDRMSRDPVYQGLQQAPRVLEVAWRQTVHELDRAQQERVALQRRHRARLRALGLAPEDRAPDVADRKSTRLNSSH